MRRAIRKYRHAVPKLRKLSRREWQDMGAAQFALLRAQVRIWTKEKGSLTSTAQPAAPANAPTQDEISRSRELARAVNRAAAFGVFRPACLVQSITLCRMMEQRGLTGGAVRVGVAMRREKLHAHAWVEYGGVVLLDDELGIAGYEQLPDIDVNDD